MEWWMVLILMITQSFLMERKINKVQDEVDELKKRFRVGF